MRKLAQRLRRTALDLGFDAVGFAPADAPLHGPAYRRWLERGWHGEMAYMAREDAVRRRLDPGEALPGCRSIVVVTLNYAPPPDVAGTAKSETARPRPLPMAGAPDPLRPIVARYARGRDYHEAFEQRLARLGERILEEAPGAGVKPYVDYGPVLERDHAQRAGLGWIGKNTMLIDPRRGSYLLLGELLTTLDLPPDPAFGADRCGTCTRCIEACPTAAIRPGRAVDARRCISYLTIELRGSIPVELRPLIGNRVFGCDICQEVCPWNDGAPAGDPRPLALPGMAGDGSGPTMTPASLSPATLVEWAEELLALSDADFRDRYRGTALPRPGRAGLLRNVCVGLGNSGQPEAAPVLRRCQGDDSELVREHASWALERLTPQRGAGPEKR